MSPRELEGDPVECKCGWIHRPSQACPKSKPPTGEIKARLDQAAGVDPIAKFEEWAKRAQENPTRYTETNRACPGCGARIWSAVNFLGVWFDVVRTPDEEYLEDHQLRCPAPTAQALPTLRPPRRAGLPYPDD